ncbi:MAG TPA: hypothetical protein VF707_07165, partial [Ardenticatenaceae bacterium]
MSRDYRLRVTAEVEGAMWAWMGQWPPLVEALPQRYTQSQGRMDQGNNGTRKLERGMRNGRKTKDESNGIQAARPRLLFVQPL